MIDYEPTGPAPGGSNSGGQVLQCHRRAPSGVRSGNYTLACFPHVYDENWCGEYERSGEV